MERALAGAGAGVTRGTGARDSARALLRVSGDLGERGLGAVAVVGPGETGHGAVA